MRWCEKLTHPTNTALVTHDPTWKVSLSERELEKLQSHLFVELWKYNFTKYFLIFKKLWANFNLNFIGSIKFCASGSIYLYLASHHLDCQKKKHKCTYTFSLTVYYQWCVKLQIWFTIVPAYFWQSTWWTGASKIFSIRRCCSVC